MSPRWAISEKFLHFSHSELIEVPELMVEKMYCVI